MSGMNTSASDLKDQNEISMGERGKNHDSKEYHGMSERKCKSIKNEI